MSIRARIEAAIRRAGEVFAGIRDRKAQDLRSAAWLRSREGKLWLGRWRCYLLLSACGCVQSNDWSTVETYPGREPSPLTGMPLDELIHLCRKAPTLTDALRGLVPLWVKWRMHCED